MKATVDTIEKEFEYTKEHMSLTCIKDTAK